MSWNYRPLSCGRATLTTSSSSCALRDSLRLQSTLSATMYSNWPARSPIFLPQNSIPAPWSSGAACEPGQTKRDMPTTAHSGSSSGGSTPHTTAAIFPRYSPASAAPQEFHAPYLTPSWRTASITQVHVTLSFCGWPPRLACGAWRSLKSRPAMSTRMPTGGAFSSEERVGARELCRSRPTWPRQSSRVAQQLDSTRFLDVVADIWPPIPSRKSDAGFCPAPGHCTSCAIGMQRRRTRPSTTCSLFVSSWDTRRSRRPSAISRHPLELATRFSQQHASNRQHSQTTRQCQHRQLNRHGWQCQPLAIPTISEKRETKMYIIVIANALFNLECEVEQ